jgi:hypothetical protein
MHVGAGFLEELPRSQARRRWRSTTANRHRQPAAVGGQRGVLASQRRPPNQLDPPSTSPAASGLRGMGRQAGYRASAAFDPDY